MTTLTPPTSQRTQNPFAFIFLTLCAIALLFLTGCPAPKEAPKEEAPATAAKMLSISDIHFDPFYDTTLLQQLIATEVGGWQATFESSSIKTYSPLGKEDANYPLFRSAIENMKKSLPEPKGILISGDFLAHSFIANFKTYAKTDDQTEVRSFVKKTLQFILNSLTNAFPNTRIYPTLGNNDSYCGDYNIKAAGPFLSMLAEVWQPIVDPDGTNPNFKTTFSKGGYYSIKVPGPSAHRIISLNTIFFSYAYQDLNKHASECMPIPDTTKRWIPGKEQLAWLHEILGQSLTANEKVWLIYHIPPGLNIYKYANYGEKSQMWHTGFTNSFFGITSQYQAAVVANFAGHTHMDEFRIMKTSGAPLAYVHITPAISPLFGNNSAFEVFHLDATETVVQTYETHYLDLKAIEDGKDVGWATEYNFATTYSQSPINPANLDQVYQAIESDTAVRWHYMLYYDVSNRDSNVINFNKWEQYREGIIVGE